MAASIPEISALEAAIFDLSFPVKSNNIHSSFIAFLDAENIDMAFNISFPCYLQADIYMGLS